MADYQITTENQFDDIISGLQSDGGQALVLFTAPTWCIPCRRFESHWVKAQEVLDTYVFLKVDMGEEPEDTGRHWATTRYSILGVPSVKLFAPGLEVIDIKARSVVPFIKEVNEYAGRV